MWKLDEAGRVEEPRVHVYNIHTSFVNGEGEIEVTGVASSLEQLLKFADGLSDEWFGVRNGKDNVPQITNGWTIPVPEQLGVSTDQKGVAVRIAAHDDSQGVFCHITVRKPMPLQQFKSISGVVLKQFCGGGRPNDGNAEMSEPLNIQAEKARSETTAGSPTFGRAINNN